MRNWVEQNQYIKLKIDDSCVADNAHVGEGNRIGILFLLLILGRFSRGQVIARPAMKFGVNFMSCSKNGNKITLRCCRVQFCHSHYNEWNSSQNFTPTYAIIN